MKTFFVKDLTKGQVLSAEPFAVQEARSAEDRNGKPYYDIVLVDKSGVIKGKVWSDNIGNVSKSALTPGRIAAVDGRVDEYRGNLQLNVTALREVDEVKLDDYLEASAFDSDEMWEELLKIIDGIKDPSLKKLLDNVISDEELAHGLKYHPAGVYIHHGFRSGMLQHILEIIKICKSVAAYYPYVDYDLVVTGAILHDIGKLVELQKTGVTYSFALEGNMMGHIVISYEIMLQHLPEDMDEKMKLKVKNIILSHHGEREKGSPVKPMTIEAVMLSAADDMVYKLGAFHRMIKQSENSEGELSDYDNILGQRVYVGD